MSQHTSPIYTQYVRHALRFYSRHLHITDFRTEVDYLNWNACHEAIQEYSIRDKDILVCVYGERDTLGDNVYNVAQRFGTNQDIVWSMMREFERKVAIARKLI